MRLRHIALGCTLTGALGCLALPPVAARAATGALDKSALTVTAPAVVGYGADIPLSGRLRIGAGAPPVRTPATAAAGVTVRAVKPALTISAPAAGYRYGSTVRFTVALGRTFADREVALYAAPYGQARRLVASASVSARGTWHPAYRITRKTSFTVVYAGDAHNARNSASLIVQAYAQVTDRIGGYFTTARAGRVSYAVYHGAGTLTLYSTVAPSKHGECLEPESEQLTGSTWGADAKYGCDKLDAASHDAAPFSLNEAVGDRYRIRGDYFRSARDRANLNAQGPWLYFEVVR
jgi:hypothetical protein